MSPPITERSGGGRSLGLRMRLVALYAVVSLAFVLFQTSISYSLGIERFRPDLILVLVVHLGLKEHSVGGATGAFLLGYLLDTFSGAPVGANALAMTLVFLFAYLASRRLWTDSIASATVVVFGGSLLKSAVIMAIFGLIQGGDLERLLPRPAASDWLMAPLLAPLVFASLDWLKKKAGVGQ